MYEFILEITRISQSNNLEIKLFQAARFLLCHCCLVFKLFLLLLQSFGCICSKN